MKMDKRSKFKSNLINGSISARELRALLLLEGRQLERTCGSHEFWTKGALTFVLATHSKDLKRYQIKLASQLLLIGEE